MPEVTAKEKIEHIPSNDPNNEKLKPERTAWRGPRGDGGLGLSYKRIMTTMVDLFSAQMFLWGLVHCDPHPGNIFIRRLPSGKPELVLIDHGLYIRMPAKFRREYALFWRSLMTFANATIAHITRDEWGINAPDIFASATLLRPYGGGDLSTRQSLEGIGKIDPQQRNYELQQRSRKAIREILGDESKWPHELIFIGRNLRIVQGLNQRFGSPVNRIRIMGEWASRSIGRMVTPRGVVMTLPLGERVRLAMTHVIFELVLLATDLAYWLARVGAWIGVKNARGGMEAVLERNMRDVAKGMGMELQEDISPFDG